MNRSVISLGVWVLTVFIFDAGAATCLNNIPASNPDAVYQDHGNGTVTDTRTGLMWQQCSEGQSWSPGTCSGTPSRFTWSQSLAQAEAATFAGHADWRVPNVKELSSLVEDCGIEPAINDALFPNTPHTPSFGSYFWSASPVASHAVDSIYSWAVNFSHGDVDGNHRSSSAHVRLVRGGQ